MLRIQQVIAFAGHDNRAHLEDWRLHTLEPAVAEDVWRQVSMCFAEIILKYDSHLARDRCPNHNVAVRKIFSAHVNQIFEDGERYTLGHVDHSMTWRIPSCSDVTRTLTIQPGINGPANSKHPPYQEGRLCSIRVSVSSTRASPSSVSISSWGDRLEKNGKGVAIQCVAFCSSPNTAKACAITGTRRLTFCRELAMSAFNCKPKSTHFVVCDAKLQRE
jgi:hypothetical protein